MAAPNQPNQPNQLIQWGDAETHFLISERM